MPTPTMNVTRRGASEYVEAGQLHEYTDVSGLRVVARCAPGVPPKVVRVHADYGMRTVTFRSSRAGRPPIVPRPGDITVGQNVTDTYLGGTFGLPQPVRNDQGGYDWTVSGSYTYLQTTNRVPGVHSIPTGGVPYPVVPQDQIFNQMLLDNGIAISGSGDNPVNDAICALSAKVIDHTEHFPWPCTALPPEVVTNGLIGG